MRAVFLAFLLLPLAGCVGTDDVTIATVELDDALVLWDEGAPAANIELLGAWEQSGVAEMDAWKNLLFVDRGSRVHILDVADPAAIEEVGIVDAPGVLDVKVSNDGKYLFIGEDAEGSGATSDALASIAGTKGPLTGGFYVYDVSNPAAPQAIAELSVGPRRGPHMVAYHQGQDGVELVLGANADISINVFDRETSTLSEYSRYSPMLTDWNRDPEVFDVLYQGWAHDMFVLEDDQDGRLMYVANWDAGLRIVDLNDPAVPIELGKWMDFPPGHEGNLHTVATSWIGDRRITVGSVEVGFGVVGGVPYAKGESRSIMYVWDTTDPATIELLGFWENPDQAPAGRAEVPGEEITSTHNLQLVDGRVYMAHYGLGVWVIDVSTPEAQQDPAVLGYYLREGQNTWDVVLQSGVIWTGGALGVMGLHFAPDTLGDKALSGTA